MHERVTTVEKDGKYYNVYGVGALGGVAGDPVPKKYRFEKESYDDLHEAIHAARKRSYEEGRADR